VSVAAQVEKIEAARPEAVFVLATGTPVAIAFRGLVQAGLDVPVATGDGTMTYAQMARYADFLPKQLYIPTSEWVGRDPSLVTPGVAEKIRQFDRYFAAAGVKPDLPMTHGWEVGLLIAGALQNLGLDATATQLRDYLESLRGVPGIYGVYDFVAKDTNRGLDASDTLVTRWSPEAGTWLAVSKGGGVPVPR
jgi:branched-chain amino acid transport system substrate-binding protein